MLPIPPQDPKEMETPCPGADMVYNRPQKDSWDQKMTSYKVLSNITNLSHKFCKKSVLKGVSFFIWGSF